MGVQSNLINRKRSYVLIGIVVGENDGGGVEAGKFMNRQTGQVRMKS